MISGSTTPPQISGRGPAPPIPTLPITMAITARKEREVVLRLQVGVRQPYSGQMHPATFGFSGGSDSIRRGLAVPVLPRQERSSTISGSLILRPSNGFGY